MKNLPTGRNIILEAFRSTYYVNPTATVTPANGSQGAPYSTIAAVFAVAASVGALIVLPPEVTLTEAVTFPDGGDWEVMGQGLGKSGITGNMTVTSVAQTTFRLTNLTVTGTLTGTAASGGGNFMWCTNTVVTGAVALTAAGGFWWTILNGLGTTFFQFGGGFSSTTNIVGAVFAFNWNFNGAVSGITQFEFNQCRLPTSVSFGGIGGNMVNCVPAPVATYTGVGGVIPLAIDAITYSRLLAGGVTFVSCLVKTANSNVSNQRTVVANLGSTSFTGAGGLVPNALYRVSYCAELIAQGTAGTAVFELRYTDISGNALTVPINAVGLLVTAAVATKSSGDLLFMPNGLTTPTFSVSGIVTPGALSINLRIAYQRVD